MSERLPDLLALDAALDRIGGRSVAGSDDLFCDLALDVGDESLLGGLAALAAHVDDAPLPPLNPESAAPRTRGTSLHPVRRIGWAAAATAALMITSTGVAAATGDDDPLGAVSYVTHQVMEFGPDANGMTLPGWSIEGVGRVEQVFDGPLRMARPGGLSVWRAGNGWALSPFSRARLGIDGMGSGLAGEAAGGGSGSGSDGGAGADGAGVGGGSQGGSGGEPRGAQMPGGQQTGHRGGSGFGQVPGSGSKHHCGRKKRQGTPPSKGGRSATGGSCPTGRMPRIPSQPPAMGTGSSGGGTGTSGTGTGTGGSGGSGSTGVGSGSGSGGGTAGSGSDGAGSVTSGGTPGAGSAD